MIYDMYTCIPASLINKDTHDLFEHVIWFID